MNRATYLLLDAFDGRMDKVGLVSNDSDLLTAVKIARYRFGLTVGHFGPGQVPSRALRTAATFYRPIRATALLASQLPDKLQNASGAITRPVEWR